MDKAQRASALEAAYELLGTPRSHLRVKLEQTEDAVLLRYQDQTLTGVQLDESGINAASAMAIALGVNVPPTGEVSEVLASTGLLHRVLAISDLDFTNPTAFELANELVNEAIDMQRGSRARFEATPMDLDELESGQAFGPYVIEISQPDADAYIAATGDSDNPHDFAGNTHPLQLDAYVLSRLICGNRHRRESYRDGSRWPADDCASPSHTRRTDYREFHTQELFKPPWQHLGDF